MIHKFFVAALLVLLPGFAFAEAIPRGGPNDSRVRLATYQEGQVYRLSVSLTHVTTVEFGETAADALENVGDDLADATDSVIGDYLSIGPVIYVDQSARHRHGRPRSGDFPIPCH